VQAAACQHRRVVHRPVPLALASLVGAWALPLAGGQVHGWVVQGRILSARLALQSCTGRDERHPQVLHIALSHACSARTKKIQTESLRTSAADCCWQTASWHFLQTPVCMNPSPCKVSAHHDHELGVGRHGLGTRCHIRQAGVSGAGVKAQPARHTTHHLRPPPAAGAAGQAV
jgi:hypothetical protein